MNKDKFFPSGLIQFLLTLLLAMCISCPIIPLFNDVDDWIKQIVFFVLFCSIFLLMVYAINVRKKNNIVSYYTKRLDLIWLALVIVLVVQSIISQVLVILLHDSITNKTCNLQIMLGSLFLAPFFEEAIFRGVFLRGLLIRYSLLFSVILSSFIFAIIHVNIVQIVPALLLGFLFGIIFVKTHSILYTIILHFVSNLITCSWAFIGMKNIFQEFNNVVLLIFLTLALVLYCFFVFKLYKRL